MLRFLVMMLGLVTAGVWLPLIYRTTPIVEDIQCPPHQVIVRYPKELADFHDGPKGKEHYRVAYCKPTGIDWRKPR